jgi:hypothetical protein
MYDFLAAFETFEAALAVAEEGAPNTNWAIDADVGAFPFYQIVDIRNPNRFFSTRSKDQRAADAAFEKERGYSPYSGGNPDRWHEPEPPKPRGKDAN